MVLVRIPASSANLGPGFDCMGVALNLYNYISIEQTSEPLKITMGGKYREGLPLDESNLVYQAAVHLWKKAGFKPQGVALHLVNNIPPSSGLGSSSAAIVGGLFSGNLLAGSPLTKEELLVLAAELEGHPDNVAPALLGGTVLAVIQESGQCVYCSLGSMEGLKLVVVVPEMQLSTDLARSLLPSLVPRSDAVWNVARTGLLVASLLTKDYALLKSAMDDRLHEPYRAEAIPGMPDVLAAAREAGAVSAVLSGAGPTLIAFVPQSTDEVRVGEAMRSVFQVNGLQSEIHYLNPDRTGTVQLDSDEFQLEQL